MKTSILSPGHGLVPNCPMWQRRGGEILFALEVLLSAKVVTTAAVESSCGSAVWSALDA